MSYQDIRRTLNVLLCSTLFVGLLSCSGDDGETGPQGPQGEQGAKGDKGDTGAAGADAVPKAGYIDGTITGTRQDGTAFTETFKFEYDEDISIINNQSIDVTRYESPNEGPYVEIEADIENAGTPQQTIIGTYFYLYFDKELTATKLFELSAWKEGSGDTNATLTITNYQYNTTTGVQTFSYSYTNNGNNNSSEHALTVTGTYNSGTGRVYQETVSRKAN